MKGICAGAIAGYLGVDARPTPLRMSQALQDQNAWGIGAGLALFLTWALGRELDPDHDLSAFVGAGLLLVPLPLVDTPYLLVILWLLLVLRLVNRTVGLPAKLLDSIGVLGLGAWLAWQGHWIVGLVTAVAFLLDGLLSPPFRYQLFVSGLSLVATVVLSIFHGEMAVESGPSIEVAISSVAIAGLFLVVIPTSREVQAVGDATGRPLNPRRVQAAQLLALLTALLFAWLGGAASVLTMLPPWAAMLGVGLYRLGILFLARNRLLQTGGRTMQDEPVWGPEVDVPLAKVSSARTSAEYIHALDADEPYVVLCAQGEEQLA